MKLLLIENSSTETLLNQELIEVIDCVLPMYIISNDPAVVGKGRKKINIEKTASSNQHKHD
jgi:hypothetical protein